MAIEKQIPKDMGRYEAKFAGPFTLRQVCFGVPGCALGLAVFFGLEPYLSTDSRVFISILCALPLLACGWIKLYGVPFEKYIRIVFVSQVLAPKHRKYQTESTSLFADVQNAPAKKKSNSRSARQRKKGNKISPEFQEYK